MSKITKNVKILGLVSFFTDVHSEIILPILPLFLSNVLGASKSFIGMIEGMAEAFASFLKIFSGWASDKLGKRKIFVVLGYTLSTIVKPFLAISQNGFHVLAIRVSDRIGKGIRTSPRDALIADSTESKTMGKSFGFHRMLDTLGAVVGTLLAFLMINLLAGRYRLIFLIATIPGIIAVLLAKFLVTETFKEKTHWLSKEKIDIKTLSPDFKKFIFINTLFNLGVYTYALFILRAQDLGVNAKLIPIIYLLYNIVYVILSMPFGRLSDRIGRRAVIAMGYLSYFILALLFALANQEFHAWLLFIVYGVHSAIIETVPRAFVSEIVPQSNRGTALGIYHTSTGFSLLPASIIGGYLWDKFNAETAFFFASIMSIIASILLLILLKKK